jgi:hypothetical protein
MEGFALAGALETTAARWRDRAVAEKRYLGALGELWAAEALVPESSPLTLLSGGKAERPTLKRGDFA